MHKQIFLGGTAGTSIWRSECAIPALRAAGITYYDPQLGLNEWTDGHMNAEISAKEHASVLLFVLTGESRGVATIAEIAYYIGRKRPIALSILDVSDQAIVNGHALPSDEVADLNRGRLFLREMAQSHGIPVAATVQEAVQQAINLIRRQAC
jgi:hypothetical protein